MSGEVPKLKPCPFCGSTNIVMSVCSKDGGAAWYAECGAGARWHDTPEKAAANWNRRPNDVDVNERTAK